MQTLKISYHPGLTGQQVELIKAEAADYAAANGLEIILSPADQGGSMFVLDGEGLGDEEFGAQFELFAYLCRLLRWQLVNLVNLCGKPVALRRGDAVEYLHPAGHLTTRKVVNTEVGPRNIHRLPVASAKREVIALDRDGGASFMRNLDMPMDEMVVYIVPEDCLYLLPARDDIVSLDTDHAFYDPDRGTSVISSDRFLSRLEEF